MTRRFIYLEEGDVAEVTRRTVRILIKMVKRSIASKLSQTFNMMQVIKASIAITCKEIYEQPMAIKNTLEGRFDKDNGIDLSELGPRASEILSQVEHIQIVACGTSYNAGMVARYWFESLAGIPCDVEIASEYRYRNPAHRKTA